MACERTVFFDPGQAEGASVFSDEEVVRAAVRKHLPAELRDLPFRVDIPRHVYRPEALAPAAGQNFLFDPATGKIHRLDERELFRRIAAELSASAASMPKTTGTTRNWPRPWTSIAGAAGADDVTNM